ncbi:MAG: Rpn family recombination-promoting nuclease/putative transposase [Deinococcales bacterium]
MSRYINPLTDFGFKKLFGEEVNKALLIDFLNHLLPYHHQITDLTYMRHEKLGNTPVDRKVVYDLYCQNAQGERFIVELQKARQEFFIDRSLYYSTFAIQEQALPGDWNFKLSPVYVVAVLDFNMQLDNNYLTEQALFEKSEPYYHWVRLIDEVGRVIYQKLHYIFIELPKFKKQESELETFRDKWLYVLRHLARLQDRPIALQEQIYQRVFEIAELATFSKEERYAYEDSLKAYRDFKNAIDTAKAEGKAEGEAEGYQKGHVDGEQKGREEGRLEEKRKIAKVLKAAGQSLEFIQQATALSVEELEQL